jgi:phage/plasmid-like protein (TIGR03299 family)
MSFRNSVLDWTASARPVYYMNGNDPVLIPGKNAVTRSDTGAVLGVVSDGYNILQNEDLYNKIRPMVEEGVLNVENIGELSGGKRVYIQGGLAKDYEVFGEQYKGMITLTNMHNGAGAAGLGVSFVRIVCENTFAAANTEIERFVHVGEGVNQFLESSAVIDFVDNRMKMYFEQVEKLKETSCSTGLFREFLEKVYQKPAAKITNVELLNKLFYSGRGNVGETLYDAFNAVTEYSSHYARKTNSGNFNYVNFGQGSRVTSKALTVGLSLVG